MRFRVTNIRPGYCEIWANDRDGERYKYVACVTCRDNGSWRWCSTDYSPFPWDNTIHPTRREGIVNFKRTVLLRQAQMAIDGGKGLSREHLHCPCRTALHDMQRSRLFSIAEMHEMRERMEASEVQQ